MYRLKQWLFSLYEVLVIFVNVNKIEQTEAYVTWKSKNFFQTDYAQLTTYDVASTVPSEK